MLSTQRRQIDGGADVHPPFQLFQSQSVIVTSPEA
jgi:hypothetical protein